VYAGFWAKRELGRHTAELGPSTGMDDVENKRKDHIRKNKKKQASRDHFTIRNVFLLHEIVLPP